MELKVHFEPAFTKEGPGYVMRLFERLSNSGKISLATQLVFKTIAENERIFPEEDLIISQGTAREMMDGLWACGLRPTQFETVRLEKIEMPDMPLYGELLEIVKRQIELSSRLMVLVEVKNQKE